MKNLLVETQSSGFACGNSKLGDGFTRKGWEYPNDAEVPKEMRRVCPGLVWEPSLTRIISATEGWLRLGFCLSTRFHSVFLRMWPVYSAYFTNGWTFPKGQFHLTLLQLGGQYLFPIEVSHYPEARGLALFSGRAKSMVSEGMLVFR